MYCETRDSSIYYHNRNASASSLDEQCIDPAPRCDLSGNGSLLCVGLTTVDVVALPVELQRFDGVRLLKALQMSPAGTAAGTALVAACLGVATRLLGVVGSDAMGRFVRAELEHAGVDVSLLGIIEGMATSATLIPIDGAGERMIYHAPGAAIDIDFNADSRLAALAASALHYAAIGAQNLDGGKGSAMLAEASARGTFITCDLIAPGPRAAAELRSILPHVDVFLPSAVEARYVTGEEDLERAARALQAWGAGACVIKNGVDGAIALSAEGKLDVISAFPVEAVDTTSCGDGFCAGFIAATLRGRAWLDALQFAAATAACVAQGPATLGRLQSFDQVDQLLFGRSAA
jgi:sugar/nucleoside kinase (ribokinase family)